MTLFEFYSALPELTEKERWGVDRHVSTLHEVITNSTEQEAAVFADTLLHWFCRQTGALQAVFWEADTLSRKLSFSAGYSCTSQSIGQERLKKNTDSPYQAVIANHEVLYYRKLEGIFHTSSTYAVPLRSWLVLPILVNGKLRAVMEFYHPQDFQKEGLYLLREALLPVAAAWSGVLEQQNRKLLIDALQEQTERLHQQNEEIRAKGEELTASKLSIEKKNKSIMAGIQYAQRIQKAMLPSDDLLEKLFGEHLVFFLPRDVVSGDFYWVNQSERGTWIVVADCTGHGVPGALLGMMGINLLEHITQTQQQLTPAALLTYLDCRVREMLRQEETQNRDGMDMSVCLLDFEKQLIHFSGAMNSGYYYTNNGMEKLLGDRIAIGGKKKKLAKGRSFTNHQVAMQGDGMLYLCSDGFQDQFGGPQNRKFLRKNYLKLLENLWKFPAEKQNKELSLTLKQWKGDSPQTDDISIIGIRL